MFFLKNGNPERKDVLKELALGYAAGFVYSFSYPEYKELQKEIEQA